MLRKRLELSDPLARHAQSGLVVEIVEAGQRYELASCVMRRENDGAFYLDTEWRPVHSPRSAEVVEHVATQEAATDDNDDTDDDDGEETASSEALGQGRPEDVAGDRSEV